MNISVNNISYTLPSKNILFKDISLNVSQRNRLAIVGNNGSGKSTLLKIIAGLLQATSGDVTCSEKPYYIPQHFGQYNNCIVADILGISDKLNALKEILAGNISDECLSLLDNDWDIEERALSALNSFGLQAFNLNQSVNNLSGGEKTKIFLAGILVNKPNIILLDEPSNHLDVAGRKLLYNLIENSNAIIVLVSHDRTLLNMFDTTCELTYSSLDVYGGNFDFYKEQKEIKLNAVRAKLSEGEKSLQQAQKKAREVLERNQKQSVRGEKQNLKAGIPKIMMNTLKSKSEKSISKLKDLHDEKMGKIADNIKQIKSNIPNNSEIKIYLDDANLHIGKQLVVAEDINFGYNDNMLWENPISFEIKTGDRIAITGDNGSGKTSLIKIITNDLMVSSGELKSTDFNYIYLDQEYSLINNELNVFQQVELFNKQNLQEHELKRTLHHFLFPSDTWDKPCSVLSGGEKMKLIFCCLTISNSNPDMLILDEPTNNLDIQNLEIVSASISDYKGTVLVISHDKYFLDDIGISKFINLK